jgi:hypothetical protein
MRISTGALCSLSLAVSMSLAAPAWSQEKVGIATTVLGPVTVSRASLPPQPLKFRDDVFLRDRVTTGDNAITRILLGGKVIVTARERSTLTITEVPGVSTIDLAGGRIAVAVDRSRMKPGERIDIRTQSAIAGVRGTVLIVEAQGSTSTVTVLKGLVEVVRIDPGTGRAIGPVTPVGKQQAVSVRNNVLPPRPQAISPSRAEALSKEFSPPVRPVAATAVIPVKDEVQRATALLDGLLPGQPAGSGRAVTTSGSTPAPTRSTTASTSMLTAPTVATTATLTTTPLASATTPLATTTTPLTTTPPLVTTTPVLVPTTTTVPPTTLLQPLLQPIVQPVVQTVVQPVTNLLK